MLAGDKGRKKQPSNQGSQAWLKTHRPFNQFTLNGKTFLQGRADQGF